MSQKPLFDRALFTIPDGAVYLCCGGESPFFRSNLERIETYARLKGLGNRGREAIEAEIERVQGLVAGLWNVPCGDIGFTSTVAEAVSMISDSIDWNEGYNVCLGALEYPSLAVPFALQRPKLELRLAQDETHLARLIDERTRVIAVSYVSYADGARVDLGAYRKLADSVNAMLLVDFSQAAGSMPIDASLADFAFSSTYKWMLGVTGTAVICWNRSRQPHWTPRTGGWRSLADASARPDYNGALALRDGGMRFTRGNPSHPSLFVLGGSTDYLSGFAATEIQSHVQALAAALMERLERLRIPFTTPVSRHRHGASVCIESPVARGIVNRLEEQGIYVSNGRGRIRLSFHGYSHLGEVDRVAEALAAEWR